MSAVPIESPSEWYCEKERATVENRGADFGKIYLHDEDGEYRGYHLLWTSNSISHPDFKVPDEMVGRAVRALAASPWRPKFLEAT